MAIQRKEISFNSFLQTFSQMAQVVRYAYHHPCAHNHTSLTPAYEGWLCTGVMHGGVNVRTHRGDGGY